MPRSVRSQPQGRRSLRSHRRRPHDGKALDAARVRNAEWDAFRRRLRGRTSSNARPNSCEDERGASDGAGRARSGKTLPNALGEVREAVDFLRYYASAGAAEVRASRRPSGSDRRGQPADAARARAFSASAPWNFPLAIFAGQVGGSARGRQRGAGETGRADAADRRGRGAADA